MKRFHVNLGVADLQQSISFYETLFGAAPTVRKSDYAKWMLDDPKVNFSIAESRRSHGINHVGLQVESQHELDEIQTRLERAGQNTVRQPDAECCYAQSAKTWAKDPDGVAWETFLTHGALTYYGNDRAPRDTPATVKQAAANGENQSRCCA